MSMSKRGLNMKIHLLYNCCIVLCAIIGISSQAIGGVRIELPDVSTDICRRLIPSVGTDLNSDLTKLPYSLILDKSTTYLDTSRFRNAEAAVTRAAWTYALETGDYKVNLEEIIINGYFPFNIFPEGTDMKTPLRGYHQAATLTYKDLIDIGTPEWKHAQKSRILWLFYTEYYFPFRLEAGNTIIMPVDTEKYYNFWINPISGKTAETGTGKFDLINIPLLRFGIYATSEFTDGRYDNIEVPMFNCQAKSE